MTLADVHLVTGKRPPLRALSLWGCPSSTFVPSEDPATQGLRRLTRILLAVNGAAGGVAVIEQIENGVHYSELQETWEAVAVTAEHDRTRVIASTQSFECIAAAHRVLPTGLVVHRVEEGGHCVTLEEDAIRAAIRHGLEIR